MGSQISEFNKSGTMADSPGRGLLIVVLLAALAVVATAAVIVINRERGSDAVSVAPVNLPAGDRPAYYTEPYWEQARAYEFGPAKAAAADTETQQFLIERGWMTAGAVVGDTVESADEPAYFTEPYWRQAEMYESGADRAEAIDAYFTERYWRLATQSILTELAGVLEGVQPNVDLRMPRPR